jgi:hypothetical protein
MRDLQTCPRQVEHAFKSFSCNTYRTPRKCCKEKTYAMTNSLKCYTYKKQGWGGSTIDVPTLRRCDFGSFCTLYQECLTTLLPSGASTLLLKNARVYGGANRKFLRVYFKSIVADSPLRL